MSVVSDVERQAAPPIALPWRGRWGRRAQSSLRKWIAFLVLLLLSALFIAPLLWMISTSLKEPQNVFSPGWIPKPIAWHNYKDALTSAPFSQYFYNSAVTTGLSTVGAVLSSSLVAYSFARLKWPGRELWFGVVLATMILPGVVTWIPQYLLFSKIGWVNTFRPLIVPAWLGGTPFYIFLLRQFYRTLPMEISEAARIDGASELRIWWQIIMPLSRPALAAVTIFAFTGAWQDFFKPLIYLSDEKKYTLQLGLKIFTSGGGGLPQWHWLMAASLVVMLPILVIFFLGQKYFIEGLAAGSVKG